ncbi:MAG: 50S ribosomal protein L29 [Candidatus Cyclonatronum sp.]|uniref:50S ribosomal protein L29 n=1 Tax=Cyclonatronum sp. TaxID=3024185 RepID=UPI0025C11261|nr:50S ribosomal protein L29 [Cyclonatronum sp.]MCC5934999.1 50S ribosomal protein L29 [Balneolales bacterium]MCH8487455.1 50S ribosomal protein L29 [Cyclonatronum sp.]
MKPHELRELSLEELQVRVKENESALQKMRFNKAVAGQVENPARFKMLRRDTARLLTIIAEKEQA